MVKKSLLLLAVLSSAAGSFAQPSLLEGTVAVGALPKTSWALQLPGVSHHFQPPTTAGRTWNERNAALGLEFRQRHENYVLKYSIAYMRDSLDRDGVVGGLTWQKPLYLSSTWTVDAGAGAFLFYRAQTFTGPRQLFPGLLPVLSLQHEPTKLGLNVLFVPHFKVGNNEMPAVLFAQLSKSF